jgi:hypothetical protein
MDNQSDNLTDLDARISAVLNADANAARFFNPNITRFGWKEGFLIQVDATWYFIDHECDKRSQLPSFVRTRADAEAFIVEADRWFVDGAKRGYADAKNELRAWLLQPDSYKLPGL